MQCRSVNYREYPCKCNAKNELAKNLFEANSVVKGRVADNYQHLKKIFFIFSPLANITLIP